MRRRLPFLIIAALTGGAFALATRGPAADSSNRSLDATARVRLETNLAAFHRLSPAKQAAIRRLDAALAEEDAVTRQRLFGVMLRYAGWLSRLPAEDRQRLNGVTAGPERLRLVRETLERQWFAGLPKAYRDEYVARPADQPALLEKWKAEERERRTARADALREVEFGPPIERAFREEVQKWVRETLEPKLNKRESQRLTEAYHAPWIGWFERVAVLSNRHQVKPPGPPEFWRRLAERNKQRALMPE
jgi:hypothetical protein